VPQPILAIGKRAVGVAPELTGLRILIVDDHAIVREGLQRILSANARWRVTEKGSALEALDVLARQDIDLSAMPGGMPALSKIKVLPYNDVKWDEDRSATLSRIKTIIQDTR